MAIIGLGGIFIRSKNREKLLAWYKANLNIPSEDWGQSFEWKTNPDNGKKLYSVFSLFKEDTDYIPKEQTYMINFIIDDFEKTKTDLISKGVKIIGEESSDYGNFLWIEDLEMNKIELWEPA